MWPQDWPFWTQVLLAIVVFDVGTTLFHLLSHRSSLLWRFHAVHHASKRLYGLNGIMKHPLFQLMNALVALGPLVIIGIPQNVATALVFSIFLQLLIQHSNADMRTGPFRRIFATAEVHRFHHLQGKAGDVNFGLFFSVWDFLLGTAYFETRGAPLHSTDIGIDRTSHYPVDYWGQLKAPFQDTPRTDESVILGSGPAFMNASTSGHT
jgi:sterol desaturase/sphingolipid hydroxylase (fatty acid hydroxylase superfamily)